MDDQPRYGKYGDETIASPAGECPFRRVPYVGWIVTLPLVAGHFMYNLLLPQMFDWDFLEVVLPEEIGVTIMFTMVGVSMSQVNLIAVLAAFSPGKLVNRVPIAVVLGVLMWSSLVLGNQLVGQFGTQDIYTLGILIGVGITVASIPLAVATWSKGWRLIGPDGLGDRDDRFSIRNMMIAMGVLAGAMAIGRSLVPRNQMISIIRDYELYVFVGMIALANLAVVVPGVWVSFLYGDALRRWLISWLIGLCLVGLILGMGIHSIGGGPGWIVVPLMAMLIAQAFTLFGTLWVLRKAGYQLIRR